MNKSKIFFLSCTAIAAVGFFVASYMLKDTPRDIMYGEVTVVETADRTNILVPDVLTEKGYGITTPEGTNLSKTASVYASTEKTGFLAINVNDGDVSGESYWESAKDTYPSTLTAKLKNEENIDTVRVRLVSDEKWEMRTQTFSIDISENGEIFTELIPEKEYVFDMKTGNEAIIDLGGITAKAIRLNFTSNSIASAAQVAELEIYAE